MSETKAYDWKVGLKKALYAAGAAAVAIHTAVQMLGGDSLDAKTLTASAVIAAVLGGIKAATNWWKNAGV